MNERNSFEHQMSLWNFIVFFLFVFFQLNGATYKSEMRYSGGGVGRNIAEGLQKLNGAVSLISAFGNDQNGDFLRKTLPEGATGGSRVSDTFPTANCAVILNKHGDCKLNVGDMTIHGEITPDLVSPKGNPATSCFNATLTSSPFRFTATRR